MSNIQFFFKRINEKANLRNSILSFFQYFKNLKKYKSSDIKHGNFAVQYRYLYPRLGDRYSDASTNGLKAYFWQDLWAARHIHDDNPEIHYDIGSRIDGFIAHLASFRSNIILIDVRPFDYEIPGVSFVQANATDLSSIDDESIYSLSALCSLEHFGMGRYGDPIDVDASYKAMKSIVRVLAKGGRAYISVPIGYEHIEFDAHRIFYAKTVVEWMKPCKLIEYSSSIGSEIEYDIELNKYDKEMNNHGYRFGLFMFEK